MSHIVCRLLFRHDVLAEIISDCRHFRLVPNRIPANGDGVAVGLALVLKFAIGKVWVGVA